MCPLYQLSYIGRKVEDWENAVDLLKMYRVILSSVSEEFRRNSEERWQYYSIFFDKDPLHSHCYHVNDCQKSNFVTKRRSAFLYWKKMPSPFSNKILLSLIKGRQCLRKCAPPFITKILTTAIIYLITMWMLLCSNGP